MKIEYFSQRYEVHLPVSVWTPNHTLVHGTTEFISSHDIRFSLDNFLAIEQGAPIALRVSLPLDLTGGNQVQLRASGQVLRTERPPDSNTGQTTVVATLDWYDFARGETAIVLRAVDVERKRASDLLRKRAASS
jgi:hypothetical protein